MQLYYLLLLVCSFLVLTVADDAKTETKIPATTAKTAPASTTPQPKSKPICEICTCKKDSKILDCSNKQLKSWPTIEQWTEINNTYEIINFNQNNFEDIKVFPKVTIKTLILANNQIKAIERGAFKNLQQLTSLDLSHNNLTAKMLQPEVFEGDYSPEFYVPIPKLRDLNLAYNDLHTLDQDLFEHMPALENLTLRNNSFNVIDHLTTISISSIGNLQYLDMSYIGIKDLPESIFNAPRALTILNLKGNLFKRIPAALTHAINLKELYLDENPFEDFTDENIFPILTKLEKLTLTKLEGIKKIGRGAFSGLINLQELNMEKCLHLEEIHMQAFSRPGEGNRSDYPLVKTLNLRYNNLTSLDHSVLATWEQVNLIIGNNSWDCECQNEWLIYDHYPTLRKQNLNASLHITCASPASLKDMPFEKIYNDLRMLRCPDRYGNHPENDGALLVGLLVGLLLGIPIAMAMVLLYKRGCFGLFNVNRYEHSRALYKRASFNEDY